jgi:protein gp37
MGKTKIDWPGLTDTWNVHTGCRRGCHYCVVRKRVWPRIKHCYGGHDFNKIVFHPEKLMEYDNKNNKVIFVNFYSDIEFVPIDELKLIVDKCRENQQNKYLFLSKSVSHYFKISDWPCNTLLGLTIEHVHKYSYNYDLMMTMKNLNNAFLSIEPLCGYVDSSLFYDNFKLIIIGAMTGPKAIKPKKDWIQSVIDHVPSDKIYWKSNIKPYLKEYGFDG